MTELVHQLGGNAEHLEMNDLVVAPLDDVDNPGEEGLGGIASDDDPAGSHSAGLSGICEQGPHEAGLVNLLHIGGNGHRNLLSR